MSLKIQHMYKEIFNKLSLFRYYLQILRHHIPELRQFILCHLKQIYLRCSKMLKIPKIRYNFHGYTCLNQYY